ncbi:MAG: hypothetical protein LBR16_07750 [Treponema sp.]|nr:hypothetical protein [Treponema sp.]
MKKLAFLAATALAAAGGLWAENKIFSIGSYDDGDIFFLSDKEAYCVTFCTKHLRFEYFKFDRNAYWLESDGYYRFNSPSQASNEGRYIIIDGEYTDQVFFQKFYDAPKFKLKEFYSKDNEEFVYYKENTFKKVVSSHHLIENSNGKTISYAPWNLFEKVVPSFTIEGPVWLHTTPPWAEGDPGPGIGAYIEVEFVKPVRIINILNGYVDIAKRRLYKQNNRVKTMTVLDVENNETYTMRFEDYVYFNYLRFNKGTKHIKLLIDSVYPDTKYDDTCISAITFNDRDWRPQSERIPLKEFLSNYAERCLVETD